MAAHRNWPMRDRDPSVCPHPHKFAYTTKAKAKAARQRLRNMRRESLQVYRCACGHWHLGHRKAAA